MEHTHHVSYELLLIIPLISIALVIAKKRLLKLSSFTMSVIVLVLLFTVIQNTPAIHTFKFHHQTQSVTEHSCCQLVMVTLPNVVHFDQSFPHATDLAIIQPHLAVQIFLDATKNKSPPSFS